MMKKNSLGDYIIYYLAKMLAVGFRLMPVTVALFIARRIGESTMPFSAKRCRIAYANLKAAFGTRCAPKELRKIVRSAYANIGQGLIEVFLLPKINEDYLRRYIKFENLHFAKDVLDKGKGLIFLTGHFGNWEMANAALPLKGFSYKAIAREQKPYMLNSMLNSYRESKGCKILMKGPAVREAITALRSNGIVGMLVDQDAGKKGVFVDLFGRKASSNRGVMEIALKTGATIIPGFAIREKGPFIRFKLFGPLIFQQGLSKEESVKDGFRQYIECLEETISEYPDQWLWQHRRWKSTPIREVIILDDGRTGHLRQSEALAYMLRDIWQAKGYDRGDMRLHIIGVEFKDNRYRWLLSLITNLPFICRQGRIGILRLFLNEASYKRIASSYADIVISCGSSTAAPNLFLAKESNSKSLVLMKPQLISLRKFGLAIIPRHDRPKKLRNVIMTDGALNIITDNDTERAKKILLEKTGKLRGRVISLFIGAGIRGLVMDKTFVENLLDKVLRLCEGYDCDLLLTTSRRTDKDIEGLVKKVLSDKPRCKLVIIANENNIDHAVGGMLGLSKIALVSQESISMISEAASSDAHTIVFTLNGEADTRHKAFLENLSQKNFIELVDIKDIASVVASVFTKGSNQEKLNDLGKITKALEALL